ncbi:hypothetical protein Q8F55_007261 [Vanrija albida]|uniref:TauD/TfdA-like domain-containing protein n=1 Tax=Vanrija albida TaxID=181172 RepID=A0ABR3PZF2_9TREE
MTAAAKITNNGDVNVTSLGKEFRLAKRTKDRLLAAGIDISAGYPYYPDKPKDVSLAGQFRGEAWEHDDPGKRADPEKKALFGAAEKVVKLTPNIGTEIIGLQLSQLTDTQKDELALLVAERTVVFFRDQDITPQGQLELGAYLGRPEIHPSAARVPGLPGVTVISDELARTYGVNIDFQSPFGTQEWHTDLTHEPQPPGYTHLHLDAGPEVGGDTYWASGYTAYDKLSPTLRAVLDPLEGLFRSEHLYPDPENPDGPRKPIITAHPLIRTHPVTGWKSLFVNRRYTVGIKGLKAADSAPLLQQLYDVYEHSLDAQLRWKWTPGTSAIWDNRVSIHSAVYDYGDGGEPRHGTRVSSLAEVPFNSPNGVSRRAALGLDPGKIVEVKKVAGTY